MEYYSFFKKEGNPAICKNQDELVGHYTKWNKVDTEKQIEYDFIYMWNLVQVIESENR